VRFKVVSCTLVVASCVLVDANFVLLILSLSTSYFNCMCKIICAIAYTITNIDKIATGAIVSNQLK